MNPMVTPLDVIVLEGIGVAVAVGAAGAATVLITEVEDVDPGKPDIDAVMEG